jgi:ubiquinone/menaquinone biosynthesis C-methylase UbiE
MTGPFTDPARIRGELYASADRLARRTGALHRAKVSGRHAGQVIADLAAQALTRDVPVPHVADLGCGRGTTTRLLAERLPAARIAAVDVSAAMLGAAQDRLPPGRGVLVQADFHRLPFAAQSCDVIVAAFCLYHSPSPGQAVSEIGRCLRPGGTAVLVTKSAGSYRELDHLVARTGLDPGALTGPSLYATAHSGNLTALTAPHLRIAQVINHAHRFTFASLAETAEYLATSPKYHLPAALATDPAALAAALRLRLPDVPVTATSTVTYITATAPRATRP